MQKRCIRVIAAVCFVVLLQGSSARPAEGQSYFATTSLKISVCGDAIVQPGEVCDDGANTGLYGTSTATRNCKPLCDGFAPYCGDSVLQPLFGEECDDGNNTSGDLCSAICIQEEDPVDEASGSGSGGSGGGGGGGSSSGGGGEEGGTDDGVIEIDADTLVAISGKAYPDATISVLVDGAVEEVIEADSDAAFSISFSDLTPGATTFGFRAEDADGRTSILFASTFEVVQSAVTSLSGLLLPPTIAVDPERLPRGELLNVMGSAVPEAPIELSINADDELATTSAAGDGRWSALFDTSPLANEAFSTVKVRQTDPQDMQSNSSYSAIQSFYVGVRDDVVAPGSADLNGDGAVNLTDFSILLFNWGTASAAADINKDGTVSLPDFSIMLFNWTG